MHHPLLPLHYGVAQHFYLIGIAFQLLALTCMTALGVYDLVPNWRTGAKHPTTPHPPTDGQGALVVTGGTAHIKRRVSNPHRISRPYGLGSR